MTPNELQNAIRKLKTDALNSQQKMLTEFDTDNKDKWISNYSFYNGEITAFQMCLDLLNEITGLEQDKENKK